MVKKLIKHEFLYYICTLGLFVPLIIAVGAVTRVFYELNGLIPQTDKVLYTVTSIAAGMSQIVLIFASVGLILFASIVNITRFYKNLYSSEGYLTFTLPVTNTQHILVKLLVSVTATAVCWLSIFTAWLIGLTGTDTLLDVVITSGNLGEITGTPTDPLPIIHGLLYFIELLLITLVGLTTTPLLHYACISFGQIAQKNRILLSVGAYIVHYFVSQMISTTFLSVFAVLTGLGALDGLMAFLNNHPYATAHIVLLLILLVLTALSSLYFFITHFFMTRKLNLE